MEIKKGVFLIALNILVLALALYLLDIRYTKILSSAMELNHYEDALLNARLLRALSFDINSILITALALLVVNLILLKKWMNAKHWILKALLIFVISAGLSVFYQIQRVNSIKQEYKDEVENRRVG